MAITASQTSAIEQTRMTTIRHLDDAASPAAASYKLGYKPRYICVEQATDGTKLEWHEGMASASAIATTAAGARTAPTSGGITVASDTIGWTVVKDKQYRVVAIG